METDTQTPSPGDFQKQIAKIKQARKRVAKASKAFEKAKAEALDVRESAVKIYQRSMGIAYDAEESGTKLDALEGYEEMSCTMALLVKEYQNLLRSI